MDKQVAIRRNLIIAMSVSGGILVIASVHFLAVIILATLWLDIDSPVSAFEPFLYVLMSPVYLLTEELSLGLLVLNSFFWGGGVAGLGYLWFVRPAWRFSLRTMLIATTLVAVVLGLGVWMVSK